MGNIYDRAFRTILNDCRKLTLPLINEFFGEEYQKILERLDGLERQGAIGAFDKRTIIEVSDDVIKAIAQKYENVQKGIGEIMRVPLIKIEARTILNQGISQGVNETKKKTALKMLLVS